MARNNKQVSQLCQACSAREKIPSKSKDKFVDYRQQTTWYGHGDLYFMNLFSKLWELFFLSIQAQGNCGIFHIITTQIFLKVIIINNKIVS